MSEEKPKNAEAPRSGAQREAARRNAQEHFSAAEKRESEVRREIQREQAATAAKTAKLRALRLEKEAADRLAAINAPPRKKSRPR